jgi:hypothetical protein
MTDKDVPEKIQKEEEPKEGNDIFELKEEALEDSMDDDDIIDLVDVADQSVDDDDIIDLVDAQDKPSADDRAEVPLEDEFIFDLDDELSDEADQALQTEDDVVDSLGMEIDTEKAAAQDLQQSAEVSMEQVEAALERVVKNLFYEKIDRILVEVIEKTVTEEIDRIKNLLVDDVSE